MRYVPVASPSYTTRYLAPIPILFIASQLVGVEMARYILN